MTQAADICVVGGGPGGLYAAILMKKADPGRSITVYERNRPDDTFGFGVVFSDETLENIQNADPESFAAITDSFVYWGEIDIKVRGQTIRSDGHGFCGMERKQLLLILQQRARQLGVTLKFETEVPDPGTLPPSDLIIAADGINSGIRARYADHFKPTFDWRHNKFAWVGTTKPFPAFTFDFRENKHGIWILGAYQYKRGMSTLVPECDEATWLRAGLDKADEKQTVMYLEELFRDLLDGHPVLSNRSIWRNFPMIKNERWYHDNVVLIGDALHTAHYSIGSGTKLAMEDAIALNAAFNAKAGIPEALQHYETVRREEVEKTQHAADVSLISRSKQITYENLKRRDPDFGAEVDRWWAGRVRSELGVELPANDPPPPMFTPFRVGSMWVRNRVVVSPMNMYSAEPGNIPGDFHLVHLGQLAMGGAGLLFAEMTSVSEDARITPGCPGIYAPEQVNAWKRIVDFVHKNSEAKFCLQLGHAGRKGSTRLGWEGMDLPLADGNWPVTSASPVKYKAEGHLPAEIARAGMDGVRQAFVDAAKNAREAGFDMIELHMAHGYLLSSFISPLSNQRSDEYGGSLENRMRFPLEVFDAVRAVWPADRPMSVRISATDWVPGRGLDVDDAIEIAKMLKAHGLDILDVSAGQTTSEAQPVYGRMFQTPFSDAIRSEVEIPTITVGNITSADQVNTIIAAGRADLVALARPHLTDPHFTLAASAYYGYEGQTWPNPYLAGKDQAFRLAQRDHAEIEQLREQARAAVKRNRTAFLGSDS
jgi:anthraniloyl-CoA monooxygenase